MSKAERKNRRQFSGDRASAAAFEDVLSLGEAFKRRETRRVFSPTPLPLDKLSELLWAACGVNRKIGPFGLTGRTDATASNSQEIDVYVAMEMGVYLYDPDRLRLAPILIGDVRPLALDPTQAPAGNRAPVRLIYVADVDRLEHSQGEDEPGLHDAEMQKAYYYVDCGIVAANVYLYAAGGRAQRLVPQLRPGRARQAAAAASRTARAVCADRRLPRLRRLPAAAKAGMVAPLSPSSGAFIA